MLFHRCLCAGLLICTAARAESLKDLEYGHAGKYSLRLDAHIPDGKGPFPAAILIHGGGWIKGDRVTRVQPLFQPLSDANIAWFTVSYRLAGDVVRNPIGSAFELGTAENDIRQAVVFLKDHAAQYRIDPRKIVLIGESAGGQLASMEALRAALRDDSEAAVRGVVAFYSPSDLPEMIRASHYIPASLRNAVKGTLFDNLLMAGLTEFSPSNFVSASAPPFLMIHGTEDPVVPFIQSENFCEKMRGAGVSCEVFAMKGAGHAVEYWETQHWDAYKKPMIQWLQQLFAGR